MSICLFVCLSGWIQSFHMCLYKNWSCQLFVLLSIPRWFSPSLRTRRSWIFKNTLWERNYERVRQNKKQGKGVREILPGLSSPPLSPFLFFFAQPLPTSPFFADPRRARLLSHLLYLPAWKMKNRQLRRPIFPIMQCKCFLASYIGLNFHEELGNVATAGCVDKRQNGNVRNNILI